MQKMNLSGSFFAENRAFFRAWTKWLRLLTWIIFFSLFTALTSGTNSRLLKIHGQAKLMKDDPPVSKTYNSIWITGQFFSSEYYKYLISKAIPNGMDLEPVAQIVMDVQKLPVRRDPEFQPE